MKFPISVCVPTFNGEKYLRECLESILAQTQTDFELLLVDDHSTDSTLAIAHEFARKDSRIRILRNENNLGLVGNWNRCVELAQGEWIKFVFQDDLISPECLARMIASTGPLTMMVSCARDFWFEPDTSESIHKSYRDSANAISNAWGAGGIIMAEQFCNKTLDQECTNLVGEPTTVMVRRTAFDRFGLFNPHLIMSCDLEYWGRVAINAGMIYLPDILATFRVHGKATSAENRVNRRYRMDVLDDLVILHDHAFHPVYAPLRKVAAKRVPPVDLRRMFYEKAIWARNLAGKFPQDTETANSSLLDEWNGIAKVYPYIEQAGRRGISGKLFRLLRNALKWPN